MHRSIAFALALGLLGSGCTREPADQPATQSAATAGPRADAPRDMTRCSNPAAGYEVAYPATWRTNSGEVLPPCSLFDPDTVAVAPASEIPADIAVAILREATPFATVAGVQRGQRELARDTTVVDGRRAVRLETEDTESLLHPVGTRSYRYLVDLGDATLVATTYDIGDMAYEQKKRMLDTMLGTLRFTPRS